MIHTPLWERVSVTERCAGVYMVPSRCCWQGRSTFPHNNVLPLNKQHGNILMRHVFFLFGRCTACASLSPCTYSPWAVSAVCCAERSKSNIIQHPALQMRPMQLPRIPVRLKHQTCCSPYNDPPQSTSSCLSSTLCTSSFNLLPSQRAKRRWRRSSMKKGDSFQGLLLDLGINLQSSEKAEKVRVDGDVVGKKNCGSIKWKIITL